MIWCLCNLYDFTRCQSGWWYYHSSVHESIIYLLVDIPMPNSRIDINLTLSTMI